MKRFITALAIILIFSCNDKKQATLPPPTIPDTTYTSGILAVDININDYRPATLLRIVKDSLKLTIVDSTGGKITQEKKVVRDTTYLALWPVQIPDSTGKKPMKSLLDPTKDSLVLKFIHFPREKLLQDYNKNWKP